MDFEELDSFDKSIIDDVEKFDDLQSSLISTPVQGAQPSELGGARKVRIGRKGGGKSGGFRIFYFICSNIPRISFIYVINKREQDNLKPVEKKFIKKIVEQLKKRCKKIKKG